MEHAAAAPDDRAQTVDFKPTQQRQWVLMLVFMAVLLGLIEWLVWRGDRPPAFLPGLILVVFAPVLWVFARLAFDRRPVVSVSGTGIGSFHLKRAISWHELEDVELQKMHNAAALVFVLTPDPRRPDRRRWGIGLNPARPQISLQSLKPPDQQRAFDLIQTRLNSLRQARGQGETASAVEARRAVAFEQRLATMTPVTWALYLVVAANVVVWFANLAAGMHALKPAPAELFAWGANSAHAVVRNHEYWRLFTAMFLHIGLMHLALNMLGLWEAGRQLCRWLGNARFLLIYIGSGLVGSALSLHFSSQQSVSVGASGAVFGVLGALLTTVLQYRSQLPKVLSQKLLTGQGVFMAYALVQGLGSHGVDNAAHVGGLMAGALLAWLLPNNIEATAFDGRRRFGASAAVGACVLAITALISTTGGAGVDHRNAFAAAILLQRLAPELQLAEQALQQDIQRSKAGQLTDAALADAIEQHHLPAYRALRTQLDSVVTTLTAANDAQRLSAIRDIQAHTAILTEMLELEITKARSTGADADVAEQRAKQLAVELAAVSKRIAQRQLSGEAGKKRL